MHIIILNTILPPLYCSILFIKRGKRSSSAVILSQQLRLSVLLHVSLCNGTPTFETEALRFYIKAQLLKRFLQQKEHPIRPYFAPSW